MKTRELFEGVVHMVVPRAKATKKGSHSQDVEKLVSFWEEYSQEKIAQNAFARRSQR